MLYSCEFYYEGQIKPSVSEFEASCPTEAAESVRQVIRDNNNNPENIKIVHSTVHIVEGQ